MRGKIEIGVVRALMEVNQYRLMTLQEEIDEHVNQLLSSTKMLLGIAAKSSLPVSDTLNSAQEALTTVIHRLHAISGSLHTQSVEEFDFIDRLTKEIELINYRRNLSISLNSAPSYLQVPNHIQLILFVIILEALNFCLKIWKSAKVFINLKCAKLIEVNIEYDGSEMNEQEYTKPCLKKLLYFTNLIDGKVSCQFVQRRMSILIPINTP